MKRLIATVIVVVIAGFLWPYFWIKPNTNSFAVPVSVQDAISEAWNSYYAKSGISARIAFVVVEPALAGKTCPVNQQVKITGSRWQCTSDFYHGMLYQVRFYEYGWWGFHVATRDVFNNESHRWHWWNGFD